MISGEGFGSPLIFPLYHHAIMEKIQPLTYTFISFVTASLDGGLTFKGYHAGDTETARTPEALKAMRELEQKGYVQIGAKALENKRTKVTRPSKTK